MLYFGGFRWSRVPLNVILFNLDDCYTLGGPGGPGGPGSLYMLLYFILTIAILWGVQARVPLNVIVFYLDDCYTFGGPGGPGSP